MKSPDSAGEESFSVLASRRKQRNLTQAALAQSCGVSRQFLSMLESGRVQPNVQVAIKLAAILGCTVEELFASGEPQSVELHISRLAPGVSDGTRVNVACVGGEWVAHPADTAETIGGGLSPADGVISVNNGEVTASCGRSMQELEGNIIFAGCDPAMSLLCNARLDSPGRSIWVNCGSGQALDFLSKGMVHVAGLHYGFDNGDENLLAVKKALPGENVFIVRFSTWDQGWLMGANVPESFSGVADLPKMGLRIANREPGSAVRQWLDSELIRLGIFPEQISGYEINHLSHAQAVESIKNGLADLMLGPCIVANIAGLRFLPIGTVAFDIAMRRDLLGHNRIDEVLKWLSGKRFQQEISMLPGYHAGPELP